MTQGNRKSLIADAVIATLAREGGRGLTHRAVDIAAGLPSGSTSYYLPSRAALFTAAVQRLAELDTAEVTALAEDNPRGALTALIEGALSGKGRSRTLARYELALEAVRRPELRRELSTGTARLERLIVERFTATSSPDEAAERARDLLAFIDGILFAEVTGSNETPRSGNDLRRAVERALEVFA